jgi:hypothetical protein
MSTASEKRLTRISNNLSSRTLGLSGQTGAASIEKRTLPDGSAEYMAVSICDEFGYRFGRTAKEAEAALRRLVAEES